MRSVLTALLVFASFVVFQSQARAGGTNVVNPGFETGDFSNWTLAGSDVPAELNNLYGVEGTDPFPLPDGTAPHGGNFQAFFSDQEADQITLSQVVPTIAGDVYLVSFYLAQELVGPGTVNNSAVVTFNGVTVADLTDLGVQEYTLYSDLVTATSSTTLLSFTFGNDIGEFLLDDVNVSVPETSSWLFLLLGGALIALLYRRMHARG